MKRTERRAAEAAAAARRIPERAVTFSSTSGPPRRMTLTIPTSPLTVWSGNPVLDTVGRPQATVDRRYW